MTLNISQNTLASEQSLYLQQHKNDPVNWQSYSQEVLEYAKEQDKPIFVSIGYSACHWCHVMAHESFQDPETAQMLNNDFIAIKIDREEFPDLDQFLQLACQATTGQGGWPLSIFLTPDFRPYFTGTYFPKNSVKNMPSFKNVIQNMATLYKDEKQSVNDNANKILDAITAPPKASQEVKFEGHYPSSASILNALKNYFDQDNGGFGGAPKFPQYSFLEWMIEQTLEGVLTDDQVKHLIKTIDHLLMGGINDHLRGGVHRYTVDEKWLVPHFEKMLYDQAGFIKILTKISLIYPSPLVLDSLLQTLDYIDKEMLSDDGYFFATQDADSEGMEGLYFTFTYEEFTEAYQSIEDKVQTSVDSFEKWFQITKEGNFERGLNIISLAPELSKEYFPAQTWDELRMLKMALLTQRKMRIPPQTDRKGIASWNFQVLSSLLDVLQYSKIEIIKKNATQLLAKTHAKLITQFATKSDDTPLLIKTVNTKENHTLLFEDYAFFADTSFRLYELFANKVDLENAIFTMNFIMKNFVKDGLIYTRSFSDKKIGHENICAQIADQSYRSAVGNFIFNLRKWQVVTPDFTSFLGDLAFIKDITHISLQNPLAFGESIRALIYPDEAFKKVEVPFFWIKNAELQKLQTNFPARFALTYHEREDESWQICNHKACELNGDGFESFSQVFSPKQEEGKTH